MGKLTEGQKLYWRYLIDDNNEEAITVDVEVINDGSSEIEVEYEIERKVSMSKCFNCGYMWADLDEDGTPITNEYCHFDGPDGWAPCVQDDYYAELEAEEAELRAEAEAAAEEYEMWLMEQAIAEEDYRSSVEYYGEPYDYQEF